MRHKPVPIIAGLLILAVAGLLLLRFLPRDENPEGLVRGSGTVEATEVAVSPKIGGRLTEVRFHEGDRVRQGDVVARLDTAELDAQIAQAEAALNAAMARLDAARNGSRPQQIAAARAAFAQAQAAAAGARKNLSHAELAFRRTTELRAAYDSARMRSKAAEAQLADAREALDLVLAGARSQQIDQARAAVTQAQVALRKAELDKQRTETLFEDGAVSAQQRDAAHAARDAAAAQLDQARAALDNLLAGARPEEIRRAELGVRQAQANLDAARLAEAAAREALTDRLVAATNLDAARTGVRSADAQVRAARAQLDLLLEGTRPEDVRAAVQQARQAQATLRLARSQRANAVVIAPCDGVVKARTAEPGEVVAAGSPVLVLVDTASPWLRVYVPESRYGLIRLGDRADVTVDSFPGVVFTGTVVEVASEAEFTPKNVQSYEERVKLVFGVKIDLRSAGDQLRPGMPADTVIHVSGSLPGRR